jgi:hypothetical protein
VHELTFRYPRRRGAALLARGALVAIGGLVSVLLAPSPAHAVPPDVPPAPATVHPRLLFSAADVPSLRARVAAGGVPGAAWARLQEQAEGLLVRVQPDAVRDSVDQTGPYGLQNEMPTYLLNLGLAYQLSGDVRYGRRVVDLLLALKDADYPYWCCHDLGVGDLLYGIGLGFDWSYELMTPDERQQIVSAMWTPEHESFLFGRTLGYNPTNPYSANLEISNWIGVTAGGAGLTLLAIRGEPGIPADTIRPFEAYVTRALERTTTYFEHAVDPLGANHEGMTYAYYGLKNTVPFALAARREGLGDLIAGTGVPGMARWATSEQLPGEGQNFVPLNDSQRESALEFEALMFGVAPDNGVAQWLWQRTVGAQGNDYFHDPHVPETGPVTCPTEPLVDLFACLQANGRYYAAHYVSTILYYRSPAETPEVDPASVGPLSVHYAQRGLVDARTGFARGAEEVISTFEALRDGRGHFQYDAANFTIYGMGGRFAIDPGYACVACGQDLDEGYATAHNVVVVDGARATQTTNSRYWRGTTIDSFVNAPNLSLAHADLRYAYSADPNAQFDAPYAGRDHLFSRAPGRPVIVAVADQLQRDRSPASRHSYTWQMLSDKQNRVQTTGSAFTITAANGATLVGRTAAAGRASADPVVQTRTQILANPTMDIGSAQPVVYTTTPRQRAFDHLAVIALTPAGAEPATTQTLRLRGANAISVIWRGREDIIVRKLAAARQVTGRVSTDAEIARFTPDAGETLIQGGTRLSSGGLEYISVTGTAATVTVSGDEVNAVGDSDNAYRVFAPQEISSVRVNGAAVAACRDGAYLRLPCGEVPIVGP